MNAFWSWYLSLSATPQVSTKQRMASQTQLLSKSSSKLVLRTESFADMALNFQIYETLSDYRNGMTLSGWEESDVGYCT